MRHEPCAWGDPPEAAMGAGPLNLRRLGACLLATGLLAAAEPPVIPVGADAYLKWERWPYQRIGTRAYMRSTYDRSGGNEAADASHYLYQLRDDFNVTLDVAGPGGLYFVRSNHWQGSRWHYGAEGAERRVEESNPADPAHDRPGSVFLPEIAFPRPVAPTWAETRGADLSRSEEHTSELQSPCNLVCRLLLEKRRLRQPGHGGITDPRPRTVQTP